MNNQIWYNCELKETYDPFTSDSSHKVSLNTTSLSVNNNKKHFNQICVLQQPVNDTFLRFEQIKRNNGPEDDTAIYFL